MLLVKKWMAGVMSRPLEFFIGVCVFVVPVFGASVHSVVSTVLGILLITSLFHIKGWKSAWSLLSKYELWVLVAFMLYTLTSIISYYNVADDYEYIKHTGRYLRFTLIIPVYFLLVKSSNIRVHAYFMAGIYLSGPVFLATAFSSMQDIPEAFGFHQVGASGQYYRILFGNIAMLNALIMAVHLVCEKNSNVMKVAITISMTCAFYASFLSIARSGWLALLICAPILFYFFIKMIKKRSFNYKIIVAALVFFIAVVALFPEKKVVTDRIELAMSDVSSFIDGKKRRTSAGNRLAIWDVALDVWMEHPVIGTGPGDFDEDFQLSQKAGLYPKVPVHSNAHSIYFQSLATTGSVGFIVMIFSLLVFPYKLFLEKMRAGAEIVGLTGMVFIVSFAIFGLTESWTLRAPFMSMYLAYFVALMSSAPRAENLKESDQKAPLNQSGIDEKSLPT